MIEEGEMEKDDLTEVVRASWCNELQASVKALDLKSSEWCNGFFMQQGGGIRTSNVFKGYLASVCTRETSEWAMWIDAGGWETFPSNRLV